MRCAKMEQSFLSVGMILMTIVLKEMLASSVSLYSRAVSSILRLVNWFQKGQLMPRTVDIALGQKKCLKYQRWLHLSAIAAVWAGCYRVNCEKTSGRVSRINQRLLGLSIKNCPNLLLKS